MSLHWLLQPKHRDLCLAVLCLFQPVNYVKNVVLSACKGNSKVKWLLSKSRLFSDYSEKKKMIEFNMSKTDAESNFQQCWFRSEFHISQMFLLPKHPFTLRSGILWRIPQFVCLKSVKLWSLSELNAPFRRSWRVNQWEKNMSLFF